MITSRLGRRRERVTREEPVVVSGTEVVTGAEVSLTVETERHFGTANIGHRRSVLWLCELSELVTAFAEQNAKPGDSECEECGPCRCFVAMCAQVYMNAQGNDLLCSVEKMKRGSERPIETKVEWRLSTAMCVGCVCWMRRWIGKRRDNLQRNWFVSQLLGHHCFFFFIFFF